MLGRPEGFDTGVADWDVWGRARDWLGGGRFWSFMFVLLLTITVGKSTATVHWVEGIDIVVPIAIAAAALIGILALLPFPEWIGLGTGAVLAPVAAALGAWPRIHAAHPSDVLGPQLINIWWERIQNGQAAEDPSFFLLLICLLMWVTGAWLAWCVLRWRKPMLGLIPGAAAFATNVLNIPTDQNGYVLAMLVLTLGLLLWTNYTGSINNADRANVKLTGDAKWDFWESGLVAMAALIVLGIMLPPLSTVDRTLDVESGLFTSWAQLQSRLSNPGIFTSGAGHGVTGFSDDVKLSGSIQRTRDVVFTYTIVGDYAGPKYFRGVNATMTVGGEWRYPPQNGFQEIIPKNQFPDYQESYQKLAGATIDITMRAPPSGFTSVVFYPGQLYKIDRTTLATEVPGLPGPQSQALYAVDKLDSIQPANSAGNYAATSYFSTATQSDLESAGTQYPDWVTPFMQLPTLAYRSPDVLQRINELAKQIVASANATSPYDEAAAIEAYLRDRKNFTYTLDATTPPGRDKIDYFLFTSHRGYCEFFATAMGDMLRSLGIPTRLVNGFGPGSFEAQIQSWVVRGEDAHTWVEVYFPNYGWIPFEPTADDLQQYSTIPRGANGSNLCLRDNNCNPDQGLLGGTGTVASAKPRTDRPEPIAAPSGPGFSVSAISGSAVTKVIGFLIALLLLFLVAASRYLRPRTVMSVWKRMLVLASLAGAERRSGETPLELGRRLQRTFPEAAESMGALTSGFVVAAYAPPDVASTSRSSVMEAWVTLRPMLLRRVFARLRPRPI
ncbi:MAG TPA: transglutaminase domain-containing protein [Candidatus Dormibacteraeota bacterium]|nr:transglutaminase domain-containing protein [Candidatus Dormibacteraeota bacterium]